MSVSDGVIARLLDHGVETVFGIPGTQTLPLNRAINSHDGIRFVVARHETAVSYQAWGYAEASDGIAATMTVPGPGEMNAMNGLKNALNDCTPLIHLSVITDPELRGGDALHETPSDTYDNMVKANITVETPASASAEVDRALSIAKTPPEGPVRVGVPRGYFAEDVPQAGGEFRPRSPPTPSRDAVAEAADIVSAASAPMILAGGGIRRSGATEALRDTAERLDAPVVTTWRGKGVLPEDHPLSVGPMGPPHDGIKTCLREADACLCVGTDIDAVATLGWSVPLPEPIVHVTLEPSDIGRGYDTAVGIVGDADEVLRELTDCIAPQDNDGEARTCVAIEKRDEQLAPLLEDEDPPLVTAQLARELREVLPRNAIVTAGASGVHFWLRVAYDTYGPRTFVNPGSWGSMGSVVPSAIGAKLANPDRDVVAFTGDGDLMMTLHELHTLVDEGIPVVTIVCNNNDYQIISSGAEEDFGFDAKSFAWEDAPINFAGIAENMGMSADRVETLESFHGAVERGIQATEPTLVEVSTDPAEPRAISYLK